VRGGLRGAVATPGLSEIVDELVGCQIEVEIVVRIERRTRGRAVEVVWNGAGTRRVVGGRDLVRRAARELRQKRCATLVGARVGGRRRSVRLAQQRLALDRGAGGFLECQGGQRRRVGSRGGVRGWRRWSRRRRGSGGLQENGQHQRAKHGGHHSYLSASM